MFLSYRANPLQAKVEWLVTAGILAVSICGVLYYTVGLGLNLFHFLSNLFIHTIRVRSLYYMLYMRRYLPGTLSVFYLFAVNTLCRPPSLSSSHPP